jgi:hypothetical protein
MVLTCQAATVLNKLNNIVEWVEIPRPIEKHLSEIAGLKNSLQTTTSNPTIRNIKFQNDQLNNH